MTEDRTAEAKKQAQAQFDSIKEMVQELERARELDMDVPLEHARRAIEEDALSVEVRSDWYNPCDTRADIRPAEYNILLCTGGPAVRIIGSLNDSGEPDTARLECQDWFTPWVECRPLVAPDNYDSEPILLAYASCFYFGE